MLCSYETPSAHTHIHTHTHTTHTHIHTGPVESSLSSLDTEMASAERELQEMQALLSTFGPIEQEYITTSSEKTDVCTSTVEQNSPKENDRGYLSAEFESALSELYSIEGEISAT